VKIRPEFFELSVRKQKDRQTNKRR